MYSEIFLGTLIVVLTSILIANNRGRFKIRYLIMIMLVGIALVIISAYQIHSEKTEQEINIPEQTWIIKTLEGEEILVNETVMDKYWDIIYLYLYEQAILPESERQFKLYMDKENLYCESMLTGYTRIIGTNLR